MFENCKTLADSNSLNNALKTKKNNRLCTFSSTVDTDRELLLRHTFFVAFAYQHLLRVFL